MIWFTVVAFLMIGCGDNTTIETYKVSGHGIEVTASSRLAGAIESVKWNGVEFLVAQDHGRGMQSAASFNYHGEVYNPTEAGSSADGTGLSSSSILIGVKVGEALETHTQMAYWIPVGDKVLSDHILSKRLQMVAPNVIQYDVQFYVPRDYEHGQIEVLTGYMPPSFNQFMSVDGQPISKGPGEQPLPLIFSDGVNAMGIYSPGIENYCRHDYGETMKWNAVYRQDNIKAGYYAFRCFVIVGGIGTVKQKMIELLQNTEKNKKGF